MGNNCGYVRGPKEECYVDPKKAPLRPESNELKGRRYFQRKKRKSGGFQPIESLSNPGSVAVTSEPICSSAEPQNGPDGNTEDSQTGMDNPLEMETNSSRQERLTTGICAGEVPVIILRDSCSQPVGKRLAYVQGRVSIEDHRSSSATGEKLQGIDITSRVAPVRDGLLVKKRIQRQLRRTVSLGAVDHMLWTLRGNNRSGSEQMFAEVIWDSQANRRRRRQRASTCSGCMELLPAPVKSVSIAHKVNP